VFANLRPAKLYPALADACPLKPERIQGGLDLVVCRELTGDVYFGAKSRDADGTGHDDMTYTIPEIERIAHRAYSLARQRRNHVTCVDKANVLETSRVWREVVQRIAAELAELPPVIVYEPEYVPRPPQIDTSEPLSITRDGDTWLVEGPWLQRLMANINFSDYESRMYFDKMLRQSGLFDQLEEMGIQDGHFVSMYDLEFEYQK
jgi:Obg family GTPase CgtA-like protein